MKEVTISLIPIELFNSISQYLCSVDLFHLSQTSSRFRKIFHPLLYKYCCFLDDENYDEPFEDFSTTIYKWIVPSKVIYSPESYSWFENESVVSITIQQACFYERVAEMIPMSKYPMLKEIFIPGVKSDWLNLGDCGNPERIDLDLRCNDTCITTNDYISVAKNPQYFVKVNYSQFNSIIIFSPFYDVYNCATHEAKTYIRRILIELESGSDDSTAFYASLYKLDGFPNLEIVKICNDRKASSDDTEAVYTSLPKCLNLEKVIIVHKWDGNIKKMELLNELATCNWKIFSLSIVEDHHMLMARPVSFKLKLPTVTALYIPHLLYLSRIETQPVALQQFHFEHISIPISFPFKEFNSIINNIAELTLDMHKDYFTKEKHMFRKQFPNIKILKIKFGMFRLDQPIEDSTSTLMPTLKRLPFGEFDMRNANHSVPLMLELVNELPKDLYLKTIEPLLAGPQESSTEAKLNQFVEKASLDEIFKLYHTIRSHVINYKEAQNQECYYKLTLLSDLLYLDVLEYMPNLEHFKIDVVPYIKNCFTLHRLIKRHKNLKRLELTHFKTNLDVGSEDIDESHKRFYSSGVAFSSYDQDGASIATLDPERDDNILFDIQSFHGGYKEPLDYLDIVERSQYKNNFEFKRCGYTLKYRKPYLNNFKW